MIFKSEDTKASNIPYTEVKGYFGFNYETENPITKFEGELNFLYGALKN